MEPLLTIAMAVASKAVTTALEPLIHELINAQEAQNAELEQLRQEVRRLIDGPWRLSILHLRASESAGSADPARRSAELEKAAEALLQAYSLHPDVSVTRALIAADLSMVEGLIGRRKDAAGWADTAYNDVTTFLRQQAPLVQQALNERPPWSRRINILYTGIWDDVLGTGNGVPAPAADSEGESITAGIAANASPQAGIAGARPWCGARMVRPQFCPCWSSGPSGPVVALGEGCAFPPRLFLREFFGPRPRAGRAACGRVSSRDLPAGLRPIQSARSARLSTRGPATTAVRRRGELHRIVTVPRAFQ